jgi:hypothetical protein
VLIDDDLTAEDVRTPEDVARLNPLELYRMRHLPLDSPARIAAIQSATEKPIHDR